MTRATIIGGGISGIAVSLLLKRKGFEVTLVETSKDIAPVFRGFSRRGNYFDTGFHYGGSMEEGEITWRILDFLGLSGKIETELYPTSCFDAIHDPFSGVEFHFPHGWVNLKTAFGNRFPKEKKAINAYFDTAFEIHQNLVEDTLGPRNSQTVQQSYLGVNKSLETYLDENFSDPSLKYLLSIHGILYGMYPSETPIDYHLRVMSTFYQSVSRIPEGGVTLVNACEELLKKEGVSLELGASVERMKIGEDQNIRLAKLSSGETIESDLWVFSGNPKKLTTILSQENQPKLLSRRLGGYQETPSAIVLYGSIDSKAQMDLSYNRIFYNNFGVPCSELSLNALFFAPSHDSKMDTTTFALIIPSLWEDFIKWKHSCIGRRPGDYRKTKKTLIELGAKMLEHHLPELKGNYRIIEAATPLTMAHYSGNPEGGLYGLKRRCNDFILTPKTKIPNLFLTGQSTLAPGLTGSLMSAIGTAASILETEEYLKALS